MDEEEIQKRIEMMAWTAGELKARVGLIQDRLHKDILNPPVIWGEIEIDLDLAQSKLNELRRLVELTPRMHNEVSKVGKRR